MKSYNEVNSASNMKPNLSQEKKNWVSPKLNAWDAENIALFGGAGVDAASKSYTN